MERGRLVTAAAAAVVKGASILVCGSLLPLSFLSHRLFVQDGKVLRGSHVRNDDSSSE